MLVIPISRVPRDYLMFFRREVAQLVNWAGDPAKPVELGPNGVRLTPRKSFEAWREIVRGQCSPWSEPELRAAGALRVTLLEVILQLTANAEHERSDARDRQDLLISELNHRVRNISRPHQSPHLAKQGRCDRYPKLCILNRRPSASAGPRP